MSLINILRQTIARHLDIPNEEGDILWVATKSTLGTQTKDIKAPILVVEPDSEHKHRYQDHRPNASFAAYNLMRRSSTDIKKPAAPICERQPAKSQ